MPKYTYTIRTEAELMTDIDDICKACRAYESLLAASKLSEVAA